LTLQNITNNTVKSKKLPFLQYQILDYLYLKIYENKQPSINELSELTGYPKDSKILFNAIDLLDKKGFVQKSEDFCFNITDEKKGFFDETIRRLKEKNSKYNYEWINLTMLN